MQKYLFIFIFSMMAVTFTGCKDILDNLTSASEQSVDKDEIYRNKIKTDLNHFDRIRTTSNSAFFDLEDQLKKAANKNTSSLAIRQQLQGFASNLRSQNDQFRVQEIRTSEVAKLRNKIMQLNYATIQLISLVENPNEVSKRLQAYLIQQKKLINEYNKLRAEVETSI